MNISQTPEYRAWASIKTKCYNDNAKDYKTTGGKGIVMDNLWVNSFDNFLKDMGLRPSNGHMLFRLDMSKNFTKNNCIWRTAKEHKELGGNLSCKTHGLTNTIEYNCWKAIKQRCNNPYNPDYNNYGNRGIKICKRWDNSFENFLYDVGKRPSKDLSIERINNDGDYEPSNCKWATKKEQRNNQSKLEWYS